MFKKGDIVVKTKTTNSTDRLGSKKGDIWKINKLCKILTDDDIHSDNVRKATENEIKWFEVGITNVNQIPEVGSSFDFVDEKDDSQNCKETIFYINMNRKTIECSTDNYDLSDYVLWLKNDYIKTYKPPTKSTIDREAMFGKPFKPEDLKNCKIGNLTPEDHKIIQPWLFSLGYRWHSGVHLTQIDQPYLCTTGNNYIFKKSNKSIFKALNRTEIKKETILNYIKQLNTNKNEQINKKTEIKPVNRRVTGRSISIPTIAGSITSASRLIGNKASSKCIQSHFRSFKISENIVTC